MATDYYVDADKADDSGDGLSWANAKKHLSAVFGLLTPPLSDEIIINLKEGTTADYEETANDDELEIDGFLCVSGGSITIVTENWSDSDYEDGLSPVGGASFDPKESKPCTLEFAVKIENSNNITVKGVEIKPADGQSGATGLGVQNNAANIDIHYCTIQEFYVGLSPLCQ